MHARTTTITSWTTAPSSTRYTNTHPVRQPNFTSEPEFKVFSPVAGKHNVACSFKSHTYIIYIAMHPCSCVCMSLAVQAASNACATRALICVSIAAICSAHSNIAYTGITFRASSIHAFMVFSLSLSPTISPLSFLPVLETPPPHCLCCRIYYMLCCRECPIETVERVIIQRARIVVRDRPYGNGCWSAGPAESLTQTTHTTPCVHLHVQHTHIVVIVYVLILVCDRVHAFVPLPLCCETATCTCYVPCRAPYVRV